METLELAFVRVRIPPSEDQLEWNKGYFRKKEIANYSYIFIHTTMTDEQEI